MPRKMKIHFYLDHLVKVPLALIHGCHRSILPIDPHLVLPIVLYLTLLLADLSSVFLGAA
jgi:hypothetical protein